MSRYRNEPLDTLVDPVYEHHARRFTGQRAKILEKLIQFRIRKNFDVNNPDGFVSKTDLEWTSGSRRVASRIDELREHFVIDTKYNAKRKEAFYCVRGERLSPRKKKSHCNTCTCRGNS